VNKTIIIFTIFVTASISGNVGVLQLVESQESVDLIVSNGHHSPYIALVYPEFFTPQTLEQFQKSDGRVSGVLLLKHGPDSENEQPKEFSTDLQCPNQGYGKVLCTYPYTYYLFSS